MLAWSADLEAEEQLIQCLVWRPAVKGYSVAIASIVKRNMLDLNVTNLNFSVNVLRAFILCLSLNSLQTVSL